MLRDVIIEKERLQKEAKEQEIAKWNYPVKEDTIIYIKEINIIGGIETWIYNLNKKYDFTLLYSKSDESQLDRLDCKKIKYVGQPIECDLIIYANPWSYIEANAKREMCFIHGDYSAIEVDDEYKYLPEEIEMIAVSECAAKGWQKLTGYLPKVMYNPVIIEEKEEPLVLGVFSRLTKEKGKERLFYLIEKLNELNKPFMMMIFTDTQIECNYENTIVMKPTLNVAGWIKKCDYVVQLSDTEAYAYTPVEALCVGKPIIITELPMLKEARITEENAKILKFDMSNLDVEDLWNKPTFEYKPNQSEKEWDLLMKKRVFREKRATIDKVVVKEETPLEKPKKTTKKKVD